MFRSEAESGAVLANPEIVHRRGELVYAPHAVEQRALELMTQPIGPVTLRAFTVRVRKPQPDGSIVKAFGIAKQYGWRVFWSNPETDEYDVLTFVNETKS